MRGGWDAAWQKLGDLEWKHRILLEGCVLHYCSNFYPYPPIRDLPHDDAPRDYPYPPIRDLLRGDAPRDYRYPPCHADPWFPQHYAPAPDYGYHGYHAPRGGYYEYLPSASPWRGCVSWPFVFSCAGGAIAPPHQPPAHPVPSRRPSSPALSSTCGWCIFQRGGACATARRVQTSKSMQQPKAAAAGAQRSTPGPVIHAPEMEHIDFNVSQCQATRPPVDTNEVERRKALDSRVGGVVGPSGHHEQESGKHKAHHDIGESSDRDTKQRRKADDEQISLRLRIKCGENWGTRIFYATHLETTDAQPYPHRFIFVEDTILKK
ncbi:hypothetical protein K438DRAFT_1771678 [Mycena galopus ATCC 62051]|nr:hypothetical protein K438DRAFT_1771678 [Mycena galopus ATCC 62051]